MPDGVYTYLKDANKWQNIWLGNRLQPATLSWTVTGKGIVGSLQGEFACDPSRSYPVCSLASGYDSVGDTQEQRSTNIQTLAQLAGSGTTVSHIRYRVAAQLFRLNGKLLHQPPALLHNKRLLISLRGWFVPRGGLALRLWMMLHRAAVEDKWSGLLLVTVVLYDGIRWRVRLYGLHGPVLGRGRMQRLYFAGARRCWENLNGQGYLKG